MSIDFSPPSYRAASSDLTISMFKTCTKCNNELPAENFHKRALSKDGLMAQCKNCVNERIRNNYRKDPKSKIRKTREYHLANPEWSKQALRKSHEKNREVRNQRVKDRRVNDPSFVAYRREIQARAERKRRALKAATYVENISKQEQDEKFLAYGGKCWICEQPLDYPGWDHVQPLARGGTHTIDNLRPACVPCNGRKNALWPFTEEMRIKIGSEVRNLAGLKEVMP